MDELKRQQQECFDRDYATPAGEAAPPTQVAAWLWEREMQTALRLAGGSVDNLTGLSVCCGRGAEAEWFAGRGARITATDLSPEAVRNIRARQTLRITAEVADAEHLPFADKSFDFAFVRHGLHHLPHPYLGIYEMIRVARRFVIIWEAQDNWLMRRLAGGHLFGLLPSGGETEPSGNYVYRFGRRELQKIAHGMFLPPVKIRCAWHHNNQPMECLHKKLFPGRAGLTAAKAFYGTVDALGRYWGNNLIVVFPLVGTER